MSHKTNPDDPNWEDPRVVELVDKWESALNEYYSREDSNEATIARFQSDFDGLRSQTKELKLDSKDVADRASKRRKARKGK